MKRVFLFLLLGGALTAICSGCGDASDDNSCCGETAASTAPANGKDATGSNAALFAKAKCPVMGGDIYPDIATEYKGAKVYFCCPGCLGPFKSKTAVYATKANEQLVATGQAKQTSYPISGKPLNASAKSLVIDGVTVSVDGESSLKELKKLSEDQQRERVFGEKTFAKTFTIKTSASK